MEKLRALIYHSINHYFYDGNDDENDSGIYIEHIEKDNCFYISFTDNYGKIYNYAVHHIIPENAPEAVAGLLDELADLRAILTKKHREIDDKIYEMNKT